MCVYVFVYVWVCLCVNEWMYVWTNVWMNACMYLCAYINNVVLIIMYETQWRRNYPLTRGEKRFVPDAHLVYRWNIICWKVCRLLLFILSLRLVLQIQISLEYWWNVSDRDNWCAWRKAGLSATLSTASSTWIGDWLPEPSCGLWSLKLF